MKFRASGTKPERRAMRQGPRRGLGRCTFWLHIGILAGFAFAGNAGAAAASSSPSGLSTQVDYNAAFLT